MPRQWFLWLPLLLVSPSFFFGGAAHQSSRSLEEFWNLGHFAYFALFGYLLDRYWGSVRRSNPFRVIAGLSSVMAVGLSIEVIQLIMGGRSFSLLDLSRDLSGGVAILLLRIRPTVSRRWALLSGALAIGVVIVNCIPLTGFLVSPITQNDGHFFRQVDGPWLIEPTTGALPRTPRFFKAWGQQIVGSATGGKKKREPGGSLFFDDYSPPIRLSLDGLLLSRARLRFTEPLRISLVLPCRLGNSRR
ncbi:MAG: hypothetical protein ACD_75C00329G0002 [uncultured bacterium]|nr:MAG: hypothetical protein ACD_75C00329G0002 [uncultured bacterium]